MTLIEQPTLSEFPPGTMPLPPQSQAQPPHQVPPQNHVPPHNLVAPKNHQPKPKRGWRFWVGFLMLVGGVGLGGLWWWNTFGTTIFLRGALEAEVQEFTQEYLQGSEEIVDPEVLIRDFTANPPPELQIGATGTALGILTIPSWQGELGVQGEVLRNRILLREGGATMAETNQVLNTGAAAHYPETAGPGQIGNFAISAHRRSYGDSFLHLPDLTVDDWVLLETPETWFIYRVIDDGTIVLPTDTFVLNPDPFSPVGADGLQTPTRRLITMTTCSTASGGPWGNSHRYIVHGELYAWMPRSAGVPPMVDHYWVEDDAALSS